MGYFDFKRLYFEEGVVVKRLKINFVIKKFILWGNRFDFVGIFFY